jgi:ADP-ribose pyrophosphatase
MEIQRPKSKQPIPASAKCVFKGVLFDVYQWEQELYDGTTTTFEKLKRADSAVVFPVLPDGRILLTEQEQPGRELFIGACGGRIDEGEDALTAAKRELLEESGYEAEEFVLWDAQHPTNKLEWVVYTFIAKGLTKVAGLNPDGGEKIKLKPVSFDEFVELASSDHFAERWIVAKMLEAKYNPAKRKELENLFKP